MMVLREAKGQGLYELLAPSLQPVRPSWFWGRHWISVCVNFLRAGRQNLTTEGSGLLLTLDGGT